MGLVEKLAQFEKSGYQENPEGEDKYSRFLRELSATGELQTFSEADWNALGEREGLTNEELAELVEQAASWLTDGDPSSERPVQWPSDSFGAGSADEVAAVAEPAIDLLIGGVSDHARIASENPRRSHVQEVEEEEEGEDDEEEDDDENSCDGCAEDCDCADCNCEECEVCSSPDDEDDFMCECCCDCVDDEEGA